MSFLARTLDLQRLNIFVQSSDSQTFVGNASEATLAKRLRDGVKHIIIDFFRAHEYRLEPN